MQIKAITFDAGGTLLEPRPSVGEIYAAVAREHGHSNLTAEKLNESFLNAWKRKRDFDYSLAAWEQLVQETFLHHVSGGVSSDLFQALYQRFAEPEAWRVYDDVWPALETLRERGFRLAVISNWDGRLRDLLSKLQLAPYFEAVVLSVDVGRTKPAPEIFQHALRLLNLQPSEVLHVGDDEEEDLRGAQANGMQALLLRRGGRDKNGVSTLTELLDLSVASRS